MVMKYIIMNSHDDFSQVNENQTLSDSTIDVYDDLNNLEFDQQTGEYEDEDEIDIYLHSSAVDYSENVMLLETERNFAFNLLENYSSYAISDLFIVLQNSPHKNSKAPSLIPLVPNEIFKTEQYCNLNCDNGIHSRMYCSGKEETREVQNEVNQVHSITESSPSSSQYSSSMNNRSPNKCFRYNSSDQPEIVQKAKQEAVVIKRISELQKQGLWSEKRLPKVYEPPRIKAHWDYVLEEMHWIATDFAQEHKWKKAAARKCARMIQKYFQEKQALSQKVAKTTEQQSRRVASHMAKIIRCFWSNVEKLVEYKQHAKLEEKRKEALDQHLSFIVDQTEKYSTMVAESMRTSYTADGIELAADNNVSLDSSDVQMNSKRSSDAKEKDVSNLKSSLPLEDILEKCTESCSGDNDDITRYDSDFSVSDGSTDDESTLIKAEKIEGNVDYAQEIAELEAENSMTVEELMEKYNMNSSDRVTDDYPSSSSLNSSYSSDDNDRDEKLDDENESGDESSADSVEMDTDMSNLTKDNSTLKDDDAADENIDNVAAIAESIQPKGNTLSSTCVDTKIPFLLKHKLREYQHVGLHWLVTMYERKLNGILADEMGLGKTIQTIALLAHLACVKGNWGPHLIIVPTSVMLNWEMEIKKWCPAFKILTYYGTPKERKMKRTGWTKVNAFHVCITSYKLVVQDHHSFRRKKWVYLVLDEAHNIKNFKSQRWQMLLNFQTERRLLLTGTPLQNNLMELWSLMHFLMPNLFSSHHEFKEWFSNPVACMIEGNSEYNENIIKRLHKILRPFLLRRLKSEVEKQLPKKYEHVIMCRLSNRQRYLYDDFMGKAKTKETLAYGNLLNVINVLMQLRKVCNHPNLFEPRPVTSPLNVNALNYNTASIATILLDYNPFEHISFQSFAFRLIDSECNISAWAVHRLKRYHLCEEKVKEIDMECYTPSVPKGNLKLHLKLPNYSKISKSTESDVSILEKCASPNFSNNTTSTNNKNLTSNAASTLNHREISSVLKTFIIQGEVNIEVSNSSRDTNLSKIEQDNRNNFSFANVRKYEYLSDPMDISKPIAIPKPISPASTLPTETHGCYNTDYKDSSVPSSSKLIQCEPTDINSSSVDTSSMDVDMEHVLKQSPSSSPTYLSSLSRRFMNSSHATRNTLPVSTTKVMKCNMSKIGNYSAMFKSKAQRKQQERLRILLSLNKFKINPFLILGSDVRKLIRIVDAGISPPPLFHRYYWKCAGYTNCNNVQFNCKNVSSTVLLVNIKNVEQRLENFSHILSKYIMYVPSTQTTCPVLNITHSPLLKLSYLSCIEQTLKMQLSTYCTSFHNVASKMMISFPDNRLVQYDCGKLQTLSILLRKLKTEKHRVLIFTQMTKMLDILEAFLNIHGYIYLRLDGMTNIEQRQILMERFNADSKYFCFILSTRSGGIGVNLTGADTVVFYDSDWNPTMDAQAQDRCHRIGQTRDVHIYRLISEKTIEENILKKASQKKLLADLAIEEGNFTTTQLKTTTIHDLFNVDMSENDPVKRMNDNSYGNHAQDEKSVLNRYESVLAAVEDESDVTATKIAKEEAVADLAEFDENIPLIETENVDTAKQEMSKVDREVNALIKQLTPVEQWAVCLVENNDSKWMTEQLSTEDELKEEKKTWNLDQVTIPKQSDCLPDNMVDEDMTYSELDAKNPTWTSTNDLNIMYIWCPLPMNFEYEFYIDRMIDIMYSSQIIPDYQLPPVYSKQEKPKHYAESSSTITNSMHMKGGRNREKDSLFNRLSTPPMVLLTCEPPKSIFDHSSPLISKLRKDMRLQKYRGLPRCSLPHVPGLKSSVTPKMTFEHSFVPEWLIHEDQALIKALQHNQELPLALFVSYPGHNPNWDLVSELVNHTSRIHRSPAQCKARYESVILPKEESKTFAEPTVPKKQKRYKTFAQVLPLMRYSCGTKTEEESIHDNNFTFSNLMKSRYDAIRSVSNKRTPTVKRLPIPTTAKNPKHAAILADSAIDYDTPMSSVEITNRRTLRIARDKLAQQQLQLHQQQQQQQLQQQLQQRQLQKQQLQHQLQQQQLQQQFQQHQLHHQLQQQQLQSEQQVTVIQTSQKTLQRRVVIMPSKHMSAVPGTSHSVMVNFTPNIMTSSSVSSISSESQIHFPVTNVSMQEIPISYPRRTITTSNVVPVSDDTQVPLSIATISVQDIPYSVHNSNCDVVWTTTTGN